VGVSLWALDVCGRLSWAFKWATVLGGLLALEWGWLGLGGLWAVSGGLWAMKWAWQTKSGRGTLV